MITKIMIKTPSDTPLRRHHGKWARATATWPLTACVDLELTRTGYAAAGLRLDLQADEQPI
jgi:hypothetical protein